LYNICIEYIIVEQYEGRKDRTDMSTQYLPLHSNNLLILNTPQRPLAGSKPLAARTYLNEKEHEIQLASTLARDPTLGRAYTPTVPRLLNREEEVSVQKRRKLNATYLSLP
jgi:hypothetical protein